MGLFNFNKKPQIKKPYDFYIDCVADFHKEANKYDVATRGQIFIPELIPLGEKTILAYLNDPYFKAFSGDNPQSYYYLIMSLSIFAGTAYATRWHENFSSLNQYVDQIIQDGPVDEAYPIWEKYFPEEIVGFQGNPFFQKINSRWLAILEPYWELKDPRDYILKALLAAYQLGVSMILEKYGY